ncbi:MAG: ABC transporter permease [Planctomycetota bacterium]|nr:ABC transporter permease [Planctomycetota bacterium]
MFILKVLLQTVATAIAQIWANKFRALLATLGIIVAVTAVLATVSATRGLRQYVLDEFATLGANKVWIFPQRPRLQGDRFSWRQIRLTTAQLDGVAANAPSIARLTPVLQFSAPVQFGETIKQNVTVSGIRAVWHDIEARPVIQGRIFSEIDEAERRQVCIINDKAIGELGLDTNAVGQFILVDGRRFIVVGVVETKTVLPMFGGGEPQTEIYVPYRTAEMMRPENRGIYAIAQTVSPDKFDDANVEVTAYLRRVRNLQPGDPDTFGVRAIEAVITQFNRVAMVITVAAAGIALISMFVGGIGIMNIMLVSVSERTREIGLRKAVGAKPSIILTQFLIEAATLCILGGMIGVALGYAIALGFQHMPKLPLPGATVPTWAIVASLAFSTITGLVAGLFPALKAAALDPIDALRHE